MQKYHDMRAAAQYLHDHVPGETVGYWSIRLSNLRRDDRPQPFKLSFAKHEGKSGYYAEADLAAYVAFEQARRLGKTKLSGRAAEAMRAFGIGASDGGAYGRKLAWSVNTATTEDAEVFVRLMVENPLLVFKLAPEQATALAEDLLAAVADIGRARARMDRPATTKPDLSGYKTVTDNADMVVMHKKAAE